jgi:hypothetical protein
MVFCRIVSGFMIFVFFSLAFAQADSAGLPTGDTTGTAASFEQRAKNAQTLFTAGSIMAITGLFAIAIYSSEQDLFSALGTTLVTVGHTGLIMTGISKNMMKKVVLEKYPKLSFDFETTSGWVVYGSGLGIEAAGFTCLILAVKNENDLLGWGGVIGVVLGEVVTRASWFYFRNNMKYWKNMYENVSVSPQVRINEHGQTQYGTILSLKF